MCLQLALFHSVSYLYFLYWSPSFYLWTVFYAVLSYIDKVLLVISSANIFGDCNIHQNVNGTDKPDELCYNIFIFQSLANLLKLLNFQLNSLKSTEAFFFAKKIFEQRLLTIDLLITMRNGVTLLKLSSTTEAIA